MRITVICVGRIKERYLVDALDEYKKRLSRYIKLKIEEVADEKAPEGLSPAEEEIVKEKEGKAIIKRIPEGAFIVALTIDGTSLSSEEFSKLIAKKGVLGVSNIAFIIGGSLGLSDEVVRLSSYRLSFSSMTFPHQLMRLILLEQIYRAFRIIKNEPYHK